ncbi:MAG TPA: FAD-dependent oxidoreductase [Candidatus Limnocylindrales bacterium]|nr:FAD-dependent oxidoreductase [Candidatus Limnocylindrales bacterium]
MKVVIIGSGPAGIVAAEELRARDPDIKLAMITQEPYPPYSPPAMADHFLNGRDEPLFWRGRDVVDRLGIVYHASSRVRSIDDVAHEVVLADDKRIAYDQLLIASGSRLHAPVEGAELEDVHDFKSLAAAEEIIGRVRRGEATSAAIVGAGFIGMEIALLLADLGVRVTIIGRRSWVMPRMLDPETAEIAGRAMAARGVQLRLGVEAIGFVDRDGRAAGVRMADGELVTADLYIAATGVKPNVAFLAGSGVGHEWGITVNDRLHTTAADIWAAGDVVEAPDRATGEAYVHAIFPNAVDQARVVAANMLGGDVAYAGAESMNSLKHLGLPIMAVGAMEGADEIRWREGDVLRKVFLVDGRVTGFRFTGEVSGGGLLRSLMWRGDDVRRFGSRIASPRFGIGELVLAQG